jgi:peptidoglycan/xylan/chitin deacetylase (PgdA/CDA1 family)
MVLLTYHELELASHPLCQPEAGYLRYVVSQENFRTQMHWLRQDGWRGISVSEALVFPPQNGNGQNSVSVTFDDGCESDLTTAAPILKEAGHNATFYITVAFLGQRGYMNSTQLRALSAAGFDVGCHSMTHAYLTDLDDRGLQRELVQAKAQLEQIVGKAVEHFSCPGGRCDAGVIQVARRAGYRSVVHSRIQVKPPAADAFDLGRIAILRETDLAAFQEICRGKGLWKLHLGERVRNAAKQVLGNSLYDRGRAFLLR